MGLLGPGAPDRPRSVWHQHAAGVGAAAVVRGVNVHRPAWHGRHQAAGSPLHQAGVALWLVRAMELHVSPPGRRVCPRWGCPFPVAGRVLQHLPSSWGLGRLVAATGKRCLPRGVDGSCGAFGWPRAAWSWDDPQRPGRGPAIGVCPVLPRHCRHPCQYLHVHAWRSVATGTRGSSELPRCSRSNADGAALILVGDRCSSGVRDRCISRRSKVTNPFALLHEICCHRPYGTMVLVQTPLPTAPALKTH
mmetsp:Transcript_84607/g.141455  ORF Transcript_84607/g.141455 Transcript_84607/m.141455 type:complete len:248 (+) Transcript_84607:350-1093(+)